MKTKQAFTLIELLIATSIFAVVMVSVYSAFHVGVFGSRDIENNITTYQASRKILERLDRELRNSFCYSENEAKFEGTQDKLGFLTLVNSDYAFVAYELNDGKLMRLCRKSKESLNDTLAIKPQEIAFNVEVAFEYAHIADDQSMKWQTSSKTLPAAVKVKLTFKDKIKKTFERTIFLPLAE